MMGAMRNPTPPKLYCRASAPNARALAIVCSALVAAGACAEDALEPAIEKGQGGVVARAGVFDQDAAAARTNTQTGFTWNVQKRSSRDYLTVDDISRFYRLPHVEAPGPKKLRLEQGVKSLEFELGSRRIMVNGVYHWLSFPTLVEGETWLISRLDLVKTVEPALRPEFIADLRPIEVVVLDPGHGGHDRGAVSRYGTEKEFALDVALKVRDILRQRGVVVIMTRSDDSFVALEERAAIANRANDALLVSIHFNDSSFGSAANGFEVFSLAPQGAPGTMDNGLQPSHHKANAGHAMDSCGLALANSIHHSILAHMDRVDRGVKRQRFAVLKLTKWPSVLVECGFLNGSEESKVVATEKWRQRLAYALAEGILEYRQMARTRKPPKSLADYLGHTGPTEHADAQDATARGDIPRVLVPR